MVDGAVDEGGGHVGIAQGAAPAAGFDVGGVDDTAGFVAVGDDLEEQAASVLVAGRVAELVEDQEPGLADGVEFFVEPVLAPGASRSHGQAACGEESHGMPWSVASLPMAMARWDQSYPSRVLSAGKAACLRSCSRRDCSREASSASNHCYMNSSWEAVAASSASTRTLWVRDRCRFISRIRSAVAWVLARRLLGLVVIAGSRRGEEQVVGRQVGSFAVRLAVAHAQCQRREFVGSRWPAMSLFPQVMACAHGRGESRVPAGFGDGVEAGFEVVLVHGVEP